MNATYFCQSEKTLFNTPGSYKTCVYPEVPERITGNQPPTRSQTQPKKELPFSLKAIYGTITNVSVSYYKNQPECIAYYDLTVATNSNQVVHFILNSDTYFVDCLLQLQGIKVVGYYDEFAAMPYIYPPQYQIKVFALDLPGRFVKVDFFDCYLVSSDDGLQLIISNNTYIVNEAGRPYCGNISNKYMIVLYSNVTSNAHNTTTPNVIIVLD